ncbi:hypothetical protein [Brevibacillus brevis]|uniref:hypothetical protein n=1 Tax=Brevibacillus brevis TaxID=1393 RepID=UPI0007D8AD15|nr:hypothetical protein [Brevibacillus brevis]
MRKKIASIVLSLGLLSSVMLPQLPTAMAQQNSEKPLFNEVYSDTSEVDDILSKMSVEEVVDKCKDGSCTFVVENEDYDYENQDKMQEMYRVGTIVTWETPDNEDKLTNEEPSEEDGIDEKSEKVAPLSGGYAEVYTTISNDDAGNVYGMVLIENVIATTKPDKMLVGINFKKSISRNGSYSTHVGTVAEFSKSEIRSGAKSKIFSYPVEKTHYWKTTGDVKVYIRDSIVASFGAAESKTILLNKNAVKYLTGYVDPLSKQELTEPYYTNWSKSSESGCRLSSKEVTDYRNWYDNNYGPIQWRTGDKQNYDIHHIRPCAYGGTKSYSNLITLPIEQHKVITKWWNAY